MKATDYIVDKMVSLGVDTVFGYTGGNITHLIDSIYKDKRMKFVETYHEQAASFAANAYAEANESIGVAISSSGPGAINLVSGIANAYYDSIPCLFITGDVNYASQKTSGYIRQNAFQEMDIVSIVKPITKFAVTVKTGDELIRMLDEAIEATLSGRKGPVLLNLPHDVQRAEIDIGCEISTSRRESEASKDIDSQIDLCLELLRKAKRPLCIVGGGAKGSVTQKSLTEFIETLGIPVVASLRGIDVIDNSNKLYCGFIGDYGNRYANLAVKYADLLLVIGSRLDDRQIPMVTNDHMQGKTIVHVDIDEHIFNTKHHAEVCINADITDFINAALKKTRTQDNVCVSNWNSVIRKWKMRYKSFDDDKKALKANNVITHISNIISTDAGVSLDVGINQMCVAQSMMFSGKRRIYTSAGHGSMGYSLPAAIGIAYAMKCKTPVIAFMGDGGAQMNIQELQTVKRDALPLKVIILNNSCLGMIRDYQSKAFESRFYASVDGYTTPSFEKIAAAYGIRYCIIKSPADINTLDACVTDNQSVIVEVVFQNDMNTIPQMGTNAFMQLPLLAEDEVAELEGMLDENV